MIPEEDESLEAGSISLDRRYQSPPRRVSEVIRATQLVDDSTGERFMEPSDMDELMQATENLPSLDMS